MNISVRELTVVVQQALRARGLDPGTAVVAARLVVAAELEHGDGLAALAEGLRRPGALASPGAPHGDGSSLRLDAAGASALAAVPLALDALGAAVAEHGAGEVELLRLGEPGLASAAAAVARRRGLALSVVAAEPSASGAADVRLAARPAAALASGLWARRRGFDWLVMDELASDAERAAMREGIEVDATRWQQLAAIGRELLAPASERSRQDAGPYSAPARSS